MIDYAEQGQAREQPAFGALLKRYRHDAGLTQEALAERAGLSVRGIQDLERGLTRPLKHTVHRLLDALDVPQPDRSRLEAAGMPAPRRRAPAQERDTAPQPLQAQATAQYLPLWPSPLIGRERDEASVLQLLLREHTRLLTLTGPGGVGKTRLAAHVVETIAGQYTGGAVFVALAAIADPAMVVPGIARALGVQGGDGPALAEALRARLSARILLLLDNFEHVMPAASALADLLRACPELTLLATSREALRIQGEREYPVSPLDLPAPEEQISPERLAQHASVALFVQRARAVKPNFVLTPRNAAAVATICRRLDGLPLAIEIAVARTKLLPPQDLLARLDAQEGRSLLGLLTGGAQDLPERQQTVRATVAWSYALLTDVEQAVFRGLAVFAGGWALEAAETVALPAGGSALDVLDALTSLVSKSLVQCVEDAAGETRFRYLKIIRDYGLDRLEAGDEAPAARERHAAYFCALAQDFDPALKGPDQAAALARFEQESENLRAALRWACDGGDVEVGLRIAGALWRTWEIRGYFHEGLRWLAALLAHAERTGAAVTLPVRARALLGAGVLAWRQDEYAHATPAFEESLALWRAAGERGGEATALNMMGNVALARGAYEAAERFYRQSLALRRELGDRWGIAVTLNNLGITAEERHDAAQAVTWYEQSLAIRREIRDLSGIAGALGNLGAALRDEGAYERATACFSEALALQRALGDRRGTAVLLNHSGALACLQGRYDEATVLLREGLALAWEMGDRMRSHAFLATLASVALRQQRFEHAVRLLAVADALQTSYTLSLNESDRAAQRADVEALRDALGEDVFRAHWTIGAARAPEQVIAEALGAS